MSKKLLLIEILIGLALSYWIITSFFSGNTKFEELALGTETVSWFAMDESKKPIHIEKVNAGERSEFLRGWESRGKKDVILFLGNSQMHSINQMNESDVNFLELIYSKTRNDTLEALGNSMPNAGLQEFYLAYSYWTDLLPVRAVVIPLFMDDLREEGVRDVFFPELIREKYQLRDSSDYLSHKLNAELRAFWSNNPNNQSAESNADMAALRETFQEKTETYLNARLESKSKAWVNRQNVRGEFFNWIYKLRNTVFGIRANSIRRMIPQRYAANWRALELIIMDCMKHERKVLLYLPPIRSDVAPPYDVKEYTSFKNDVERLATDHRGHVFFKNFEKIIPAPLWGFKAATNLKAEKEIDFMHFQFEGHRILADSILPMMSELSRRTP